MFLVKLATLCYVKRDGHTLMMHRTKKQCDLHQGKWNGLGGKFEPGETPEDCAIRELHEEAGIVAQEPELKGLLTFPNFAQEEDWYVFVFVVRNFSGEIIESAEGHLEWVEDAKLLDLNLWEGDRYFLPWLEQDQFFSAKFLYNAGTLVEHQVCFHKSNSTGYDALQVKR